MDFQDTESDSYRVEADGGFVGLYDTAAEALDCAERQVYMTAALRQQGERAMRAGNPFSYAYGFKSITVWPPQRRPDDEIPEDTPSIPNCDDWGTGEGRYHGRM